MEANELDWTPKRGGSAETLAPPLSLVHGIAYGCAGCAAIISCEDMRELYAEALRTWQASPTRQPQVSCPECDAPGLLVRITVDLIPGVREWAAGHRWYERRPVVE